MPPAVAFGQVDSENWFEGWKQAKSCVGPTLLHPVKGDACGRFSANGFGRGCWKRVSGGKAGLYNDVFDSSAHDPKTSGFYKPLGAASLARAL